MGTAEVTGLATGDTAKRIAASLAPAAAILLLQQVLLPVPGGQLVRGLVIGALTALVALGLALVYRASRVVNFAQVDLGLTPAVLAYLLVSEAGAPWPVAAVVGLVGAVGAGAVAERTIVRRFSRAPRALVMVATIGLSQVLAGIAVLLASWWGLRAGHGTAGGPMPAPFEHRWTVGDMGFELYDLLALVMAPTCIGLLALGLRRTHLGVAARASGSSGDRAALLGVPVVRIQSLVWMLAAGLAYLAVVLRSGALGLPVVGTALAFPVLLRALTAFVVGGRNDLTGVTSAAFALGVLEEGVEHHHGSQPVEPILLLVLVLALVALHLRPRRGDRPARDWTVEGAGWQAAREVRPVPTWLARVPPIHVARRAVLVVLCSLALLLPWIVEPGSLGRATDLVIYATLAVSLVVVTGWAGRISLGHAAYFALGSAVAAWSVLTWDVDLVVAMVLAVAVGAGAAVAVGLPTLRLPGLYLAVSSFGFALVTRSYLLDPERFPWVPEGEPVPRAALVAGWDLASSGRDVYFLGLAVLVLAVVGARAIRSSRLGRGLVALRDNEQVAHAYGVDGVRLQVLAYAWSGGTAAAAGAVLMHVHRGFDRAALAPLETLEVLAMVVVGGVTSVAGGVLGAAFLLAGRWYLPADGQALAVGAGVMAVLLFVPGGLARVVYGWRDRVLRWMAAGYGLVAPGSPDPGLTPPEGVDAGIAAEAATTDDGSPDARPVLQVRGLSVGYGDVPVLRGVDLAVLPGEAVVVVGTNGAGKSTLLRAVSGLAQPSQGEVTFDGVAVTGRAPHEMAALGLVQMPGGHAGHGVFPTLTVEENLRVATWLSRHDTEAIAAGMDRVAPLFPVVRERRQARAGSLSGPEQQVLAMAMAVLCRPKLLMVDGLALGPEQPAAGDLLRVVDELRKEEGTALLLVAEEDSAEAALGLADRAVLLEHGEVAFAGPLAGLPGRPGLLRSVWSPPASRPRPSSRPPGPDIARSRPPHRPDRPDRPDQPDRPGRGRGAGRWGGGRVPVNDGWPALQAIDLTVAVDGVREVDDVTLDVGVGEIVGVVGPRRAGTTTLLDLVSGTLSHDSGWVLLGGRDIGHLRAPARARRGLGRSYRDARLFPSLTVEEAVAAALPRDAARGRRLDELVHLAGLDRHRSLFLGELPTGTRKMVDLACLLAHEPRVVLLEEPAAGIAPREVDALPPLIRRIRDDLGAGVVIVDHDIPLVTEVADRLVAMDHGRIVATGAPSAVLTDPAVVASYGRPAS